MKEETPWGKVQQMFLARWAMQMDPYADRLSQDAGQETEAAAASRQTQADKSKMMQVSLTFNTYCTLCPDLYNVFSLFNAYLLMLYIYMYI